MKNFLFAVITALIATGCGNNKANARQENDGGATSAGGNGSGKAIIIFFSHAGDNYAVGNVKEGNTKVMAGYIKEFTGADMFEIVAEKSYDMPYDPLTEVAKEEQRKGELPAYKGNPGDLSQYDTVYIGGPIWWGTYPQVMFTFFKDHDLNGKTFIPFTTHEGSGLGSVVEDLEKLYPNATVKHAYSLYGHEVRSSKNKVKDWLEGIK